VAAVCRRSCGRRPREVSVQWTDRRQLLRLIHPPWGAVNRRSPGCFPSAPPPDDRQEEVSKRDDPRLAALGSFANDGLAAATRRWHRAADPEGRVGNVEQVGDPEPAQLPESETGQAEDECQVGFSWRNVRCSSTTSSNSATANGRISSFSMGAASGATARRPAAGFVRIRPSSTKKASRAERLASTRVTVWGWRPSLSRPANRATSARLMEPTGRPPNAGRTWSRIADSSLSHVRWATVRRRCSSQAGTSSARVTFARFGSTQSPCSSWRRCSASHLVASVLRSNVLSATTRPWYLTRTRHRQLAVFPIMPSHVGGSAKRQHRFAATSPGVRS
jgi:hypothetical protein